MRPIQLWPTAELIEMWEYVRSEIAAGVDYWHLLIQYRDEFERELIKRWQVEATT